MSKNNYLNDIVVIDAARTAIGSTFKALKEFGPSQLASFVIKGMLERNPSAKDAVNQVIFGNTVSAGAGQNISRHAAYLAGLPVTVPAFSVNNVCGSGLQSLIIGTQAMACGEADIVIAGGTESSSQSPYIVKKSEAEKKDDNLIDSLVFDGLTCQLTDKHMGRLAEHIAKKFSMSRLRQDEFAFKSHQKACLAQDQGNFLKEIIPVDLGNGGILNVDQRPRRKLELEKLANLPPAFEEDGTVTAGNSSIPSDGAAAVLLATKDAAKKHKLTPLARILSYCSLALEPQEVFTASIPAVKECLKKANVTLKDIDLFEISEAFAVQALATQHELKIPDEKMNIFGGDIALGHPLGAAGTRILVTLIHALKDQKKKKGIASVCLGGGGAVAIAVEILS